MQPANATKEKDLLVIGRVDKKGFNNFYFKKIYTLFLQFLLVLKIFNCEYILRYTRNLYHVTTRTFFFAEIGTCEISYLMCSFMLKEK